MSDPTDSKTRREFLKVTAATAASATLAACGNSTSPVVDGSVAIVDAQPVVDAVAIDAESTPDAAPDAGSPDAAVVEPPDAVPFTTSFGLDVASGDVTHSNAVLWTRYDGVAALRLGVWEMADDTYVRTVMDNVVTPADGGFIHVDVPGLAAGRHHRYAFFEMDGDTRMARSEIGRFRAAIADDVTEPLIFAATSCADQGRDFEVLGPAAARDDIDLFMFLGDTVYADGADSVAEYRAKWNENLSKAPFRALRKSTSVLATWDDHEVDNNWDAESIGAAQFANATQAFFENQPLRRDGTNPNRVWKSIRWGLTAEVFVLDSRGERKPSTVGEANEQYLSTEQMAWLKQALLDSPAVFKIIMNSVAITNFPGLFDLAANDRWEGYPQQRTEILSHIDTNSIGGVLWLSGDFHLCSVQRVDTSGVGSSQIEALVGPLDQTGNPLAFGLLQPQFDFARVTLNFTTIELDPANTRVTLRWHGSKGAAFETHTFDL